MKIFRQSKPDPEPFDAFAASLRVWLTAFLVWLADTLDHKRSILPAALAAFARRNAVADLRAGVADLRALLIAHAYVRTALPAAPAFTTRPHTAPAGARRASRRGPILRRLIGATLRGVHAGSLRQRAERLARLLDNLEPLIARVAARLALLLRVRFAPALILTHARDARVSRAHPAPAAADTS